MTPIITSSDTSSQPEMEETTKLLYAASKKGEAPQKVMPWLFERPNYLRAGYLRPSTTAVHVLTLKPSHHNNETINIYSHLLPAAIYAYFIISYLISPPDYMTNKDVAVSLLYAFGTMTCFTLSAIHHLEAHRSHVIHYWTGQFDIIGIVSLMTGAAVPMIYYGLYKHTLAQTIYLTILPLIALGCCMTLLVPAGKTSAGAGIRIFMFACLSLPGVVAIVHGRYVAIARGDIPLTTGWIIATAGLNALGAGLYSTGFPERWFKGFDIYGSSHQLFHIVIVISSLVFWNGLLQNIKMLRGV